jgi:hypothetical protein
MTFGSVVALFVSFFSRSRQEVELLQLMEVEFPTLIRVKAVRL